MVASIAAGIVGVMRGAAMLRVHDVAAHVEAMQVLRAIGADAGFEGNVKRGE